jgi:hypothetical protein
MSPERTLERVRAFLHLMALLLFLGTIGELLSVKHYGEPIKLVPFALCGLGILAVVAVWTRPTRATLLGVRAVMIVTMFGSLLGVYEHIQGNLELAREIHRRATTMQRIKQTLTGRDPIAAPGMLAVAALLLLAATFVTTALARPERAVAGSAAREPISARRSQTA